MNDMMQCVWYHVEYMPLLSTCDIRMIMAYLFTRLMDLDDSKAHLIAIRYLRADYNHSAASAVPPGTISLRLLSNMVTS